LRYFIPECFSALEDWGVGLEGIFSTSVRGMGRRGFVLIIVVQKFFLRFRDMKRQGIRQVFSGEIYWRKRTIR